MGWRTETIGLAGVLSRPTPAYSPRKTRAVPAAMRPMLKALPVCPVRFRVRVSHDEAGQGRDVHAEENVLGKHCPCPSVGPAADITALRARAPGSARLPQRSGPTLPGLWEGSRSGSGTRPIREWR